ncbi:apolipoprotein D and lipocalin family protein [Methylomagnum ishizawai]|uniref:Outer membrane lipoprotein Blc n=1 Tax=Methylomagnum ishizawai TaxID=1760988 RepID=A0A1Y6CXL1_9GAMM|nr:lipocalin family protein [Methylomagnum ishizawai]SMF95418.1 apolipoprotein D and lipocalin family protein [Methylomagnum ishizawai]
MRFLSIGAACLLLAGCVGAPRGVTVVDGFELPRYLGTWHEIARLNHAFERGLSRVTAEYSLRDDGGVRVVNRGFDAERGVWRQAEGKAYFIGSPAVGSLKVSFFGPFYGGYHILALDRAGYGYSLVAGPSRDYLWILARNPRLDPEVLARLTAQAKSLGFPVGQLIYPRQE